jgi:hypothetical protein
MTLQEKIQEMKRLNELCMALEDEIVNEVKATIDLSSPTAKDEVRKLIPFESFAKDLIIFEINKLNKK